MPSLNIRRLTMCSLTTLLCTAGPNVFAHTGVQNAADRRDDDL